MESSHREVRDRLMLHALIERRVAVEEEVRTLKAKVAELAREEAELRAEVTALDVILGAKVELTPAAPAAIEPSVAAAVATPAASATAPPGRKRRRKGSRMEEMLPKMREMFGTGTFDPEAVTDLVNRLRRWYLTAR